MERMEVQSKVGIGMGERREGLENRRRVRQRRNDRLLWSQRRGLSCPNKTSQGKTAALSNFHLAALKAAGGDIPLEQDDEEVHNDPNQEVGWA